MFLCVKPLPFQNNGTCKTAFKTYRQYIDHTATHQRPHKRRHQKGEMGSVAPSILRYWHLREFYLIGPEKHRLRAQMTKYCDRLSESGWRGSREILTHIISLLSVIHTIYCIIQTKISVYCILVCIILYMVCMTDNKRIISIAPKLQTCTACYCTEYCRQL